MGKSTMFYHAERLVCKMAYDDNVKLNHKSNLRNIQL